jgi:hypothetical protein
MAQTPMPSLCLKIRLRMTCRNHWKDSSHNHPFDGLTWCVPFSIMDRVGGRRLCQDAPPGHRQDQHRQAGMQRLRFHPLSFRRAKVEGETVVLNVPAG